MSNDVYQPALAQLAEHRTVDPRVAGSSPAGGTFTTFNLFKEYIVYGVEIEKYIRYKG